MPNLIGMLIGGLVAVYLLHMLWEYLLFKRVMDDPVYGKMSSVAAAYLTAGILGGFGFANGGPFTWSAFLIYLIPALIVGVIAYNRGVTLQAEALAEE